LEVGSQLQEPHMGEQKRARGMDVTKSFTPESIAGTIEQRIGNQLSEQLLEPTKL